MKTDDITGWKAFIAVAQFGNFAKASKEQGIAVALLSKRVAKLEDNLGVRLFHRSTRVVTLTNEGSALLPRIRTILDDLAAVESTFSDQSELNGVVRLTCVPFLAHNLLIPLIESFQKTHPKVKIDISLSEKLVNIIEQNIDIAIRIQTPDDTDLIYRKLVPNDLVFCASPKYLKKNPSPIRSPDDLNAHNLLFLKIHERCNFVNTSIQLKKFSARKKIESDSGAFLTDLALQDQGVLVRSIWDVQKHLKSGSLVQVLKKHPLETFGNVHAVIPSSKFLAPRVRAFYDHIVSSSKNWSTNY